MKENKNLFGFSSSFSQKNEKNKNKGEKMGNRDKKKPHNKVACVIFLLIERKIIRWFGIVIILTNLHLTYNQVSLAIS